MPSPCGTCTTSNDRWRFLRTAAAWLFLLPTAVPPAAIAEDLVTLTDQRYLDVHVERVDPDGVTYRHRLGMVKLPFGELPAPVRLAYHYDPQRAAEFLRLQHERAEENARLVRDAETRRDEAFARRQAQLAAAGPDPSATGAFAYSSTLGSARDSGSARGAAAAVGDQLQRWQAAEALRNDPTVWNERNWKRLPTLVTPMDVRPANGREDAFFTPNYAKRALDDIYHDRGPGVK